MGTRPGAVDPGVILHLFQTLGLSAKEVETILYKKSGLLGISGISNDMRDLLDSREPAAVLAVDYFVYRAAKEIGALAAVLHGVDAIVFTAGIGENSAEIRRLIGEASAWLGVDLDPGANLAGGPRISHGRQPGVGVGDPHQRRTDDCPAHRAPIGIERRRGLAAADEGARHGNDGNIEGRHDGGHRLGWIQRGAVAAGGQRPGLHPVELHAVRRRRDVPRAGDRPDEADLGHADHVVRGRAEEGRARHLPDPDLDHRPRRRLHRQGERGHRRAADRGAAEARHHAERRLPDGRQRAQDLRLRARPAPRGGVHQVPQDPQRGRLRCLHRRHPPVPQLARADRAARCLWPRPDHRRLPAGGALRRRPADRAQEAGEAVARRQAVERGHHPRSRGAVRADPGARRTQADGREVRLRHLGPGDDRPRGRAVAVFRLPGGGEGTERRGHVARPDLDLPRRLLRARLQGRPAHRRAGAGDHRRLRDQAPHRAVPAHARSTTSCSPATRPGSPSRSAAWATTAGRS